MKVEIVKATIDHLDQLASLFDAYAVFYRVPSNPASCKSFLEQRLKNEEAHVFIALNPSGIGCGFTLLYPSFSSVRRARIFILNDLFVHPDFRLLGIGAKLLEAACAFGREQSAFGLHLETEISNTQAQKLYEKEGWVRESKVYHYNYTL